MPPAIARYVRAPARRNSNETTLPAFTACDVHGSTSSPSTFMGMSAPVAATTVSARTSSSGPMYVASSTAAPGALPTSMLATR